MATKAAPPTPTAPPVAEHPPWLQQILEARRAATSLIGLVTMDPAAAEARVCQALLQGSDAEAPVLRWNIVQGAFGTNRQGEAALTSILPAGLDALTATGALPEFLGLAMKLPPRSIVFIQNIHLYLDNPGVQQGLWNLRDAWMPKRCMGILEAPEIQLPPTLVNDVMLFEEPAPDDATIAAIATTRLATPDAPATPEAVQRVTAALRGTGSTFMADQILALVVRKGKFKEEELWKRKHQMINQIKGLTVWNGDVDELAGQEVLRKFCLTAYDNAPTGPPDAIVFVDEVEKSFGGAGSTGSAGDSSGVTQDQMGNVLKVLEDNGCLASLFMGVGGVAKTAFVRWFSKRTKAMLVDMDLGSMKGSYVGQSEQQLRMAMRTLKAISGGRPGSLWFFFVCNRLDVLPPEFKRRMNMGMWFFDLPQGRAGRDPIWAIHRAKYGIAAGDPIPKDAGWTGAEIRNACQIAWRLKIPLTEAAQFIVPLVASEGGPDGAIERLHRLADQRFLSVDHPGQYNHKSACPNAAGSTVEVMATQGGRAVEE